MDCHLPDMLDWPAEMLEANPFCSHIHDQSADQTIPLSDILHIISYSDSY